MDTLATPPRRGIPRRVVALLVGLVATLLVVGLVLPSGHGSALATTVGTRSTLAMVLALALPAYLAGVLSLLSPCCLPIVPAYFSFTFGAQRARVVAMSVAFFLGLATTMVVLGASFTALGTLIFPYRSVVTRVGGLIIVGFGLMSLLGLGFSGLQLRDRPAATLAGTYLYGLTFAFGWTACIGPILGAILTALSTTGLSVVAGAVLAFVYALGLATPLTLLATFFGRLGQGSRVGTLLRGRGFSVPLGSKTLSLHTTSVISGGMLIVVGLLLASGELLWFTRWASGGAVANVYLRLEDWLSSVFNIGQ